MAKICDNIICGEKYFFKNGQGEFICRSKKVSEQIMSDCRDFDAVEKDGCIHIAAADKEGNLIYIVNDKGHWGRGVAASKVMPENIFINKEDSSIVVYYVSGTGLYKLSLDNSAGEPKLLDEISCTAPPFVCKNAVYYINNRGDLCSNEGEKICKGENISHIFATDEYLCVKSENRLELINTKDFSDRQSLTRRHKETAQCPVIMSIRGVEILCWLDGNEVFFSKKEDGLWCSLETVVMQNAERLGIYKFDERYDLGCIRNGRVCSFNIKAIKE